jgi:hypothetical protein
MLLAKERLSGCGRKRTWGCRGARRELGERQRLGLAETAAGENKLVACTVDMKFSFSSLNKMCMFVWEIGAK